jgi:IS5 family transposase
MYGKLFKSMNKQLEKHKIIVKTDAIVGTSIVDNLLKNKGNATYQIAIAD